MDRKPFNGQICPIPFEQSLLASVIQPSYVWKDDGQSEGRKEAVSSYTGQQQGAGTAKWSCSSMAWEGQGGVNQADDCCDEGLNSTHSGAQRNSNSNTEGQQWVGNLIGDNLIP